MRPVCLSHRRLSMGSALWIGRLTGASVPDGQAGIAMRDELCCTVLTREPLSKRDAERTAPVLAALGDPVRLRLLSIVAAEGEVCSCSLEEPLGKSQSTISHHTRILAQAGLIVGQRR